MHEVFIHDVIIHHAFMTGVTAGDFDWWLSGHNRGKADRLAYGITGGPVHRDEHAAVGAGPTRHRELRPSLALASRRWFAALVAG